MSIESNLKKFIRHAKQGGLAHALNIAARYIGAGGAATTPSDINAQLKHFEQMIGTPFGDASDLDNLPNDLKTFQWVIPSFGFGSGGHMTIFRFVNNLAALGYPQRIIVLPPHQFKSGKAAKKAIEDWFMPLNAEVEIGQDSISPSHVLIATGHQTAHTVANYRAAQHRLYFVQDFEPSFFPVSSNSYFAESTYRLGLTAITAGNWLADKLAQDYGMKTHPISFGVNRDIYHAEGRKACADTHKTIVFYSRHVTPRRLVELGLASLVRLHKIRQDFKVICVGGDLSGLDVPFDIENLGELPETELGDIFRRSDLGLILSGTNLSLMPLELAACQCCVVMNEGPNAEWLLDETAAYFAPTDPQRMAETLDFVMSDDGGRAQRIQVAYDLAARADWLDEAKSMAEFIETL